MKQKYTIFTAVVFVIVVVDFYTKALILDHLVYHSGFSVIDGFFNIVHARNMGAAFGLFSDGNPGWVLPFFLVVGTLALGFLASLLRKVPDHRKLMPALLGGIAGGAIGNMIDRVRWGYVVDFLDFYVGRFHWPAFNVADMGISIGVSILLILALLKKDDGLFSGTTAAPKDAA